MRRTNAIASCNSVGVRPASDSSSSNSCGSAASARDFQPLAAGRAERARRLISAQAGQFEDGARLVARVIAMRMAQEGADHDVMDDAHLGERGRHLKRAADPGAGMRFRRRPRQVLAVENDSPATRHVSPARQLKKVDLPAPLGPISPMISPSLTVRSAPATARNSPKLFDTSVAARRCVASGMEAFPEAVARALPQVEQAARFEARNQDDDAAIEDVSQARAVGAEPRIRGALQRDQDERAD